MPLVTANLVDLTGVANIGWAVITLVGFGSAIPRTATSILSVLSVTVPGASLSQNILGNDVILPSGTTYQIAIYSDQGSFISEQRYSITGNATVNLNTLAPVQPL
jgi:hypothetical protein